MKKWILTALLATAPALAEEERIGSWAIYRLEVMSLASTKSDSGASFGMMCLKKSCSYFINPQIACVEDEKMPMLLTGEAGATTANGTCVHLEGTQFYIIDEKLDALIGGSGTIGVAVPLADGKFKAVRFTTHGAIQTIGKVQAEFDGPADAAAPADPTRDTVF